jgi:hypothetical protein
LWEYLNSSKSPEALSIPAQGIEMATQTIHFFRVSFILEQTGNLDLDDQGVSRTLAQESFVGLGTCVVGPFAGLQALSVRH